MNLFDHALLHMHRRRPKDALSNELKEPIRSGESECNPSIVVEECGLTICHFVCILMQTCLAVFEYLERFVVDGTKAWHDPLGLLMVVEVINPVIANKGQVFSNVDGSARAQIDPCKFAGAFKTVNVNAAIVSPVVDFKSNLFAIPRRIERDVSHVCKHVFHGEQFFCRKGGSVKMASKQWPAELATKMLGVPVDPTMGVTWVGKRSI